MTYEEMEELDRKYANGALDVFEFLSLIPDEYIPEKEKLVEVLKERRNETISN